MPPRPAHAMTEPMTDSRHSPWWRPAVTLAERARHRGLVCVVDETSRAHRDANSGLHRWRAQRPFDRAELFAQRLGLDGLDELAFEALLDGGADASAIPAEPPAWVRLVDHANEMARAVAHAHDSLADSNQPGDLEPVRAFVEPFVATGLRCLVESARAIHAAHVAAPFTPERAAQLFETSLWNRLLMRAVRVIVLELNVARVRGILVGDTPEARCANFTTQIRTGDLRQRIIDEYPVLARVLAVAVDFWHRAAVEFLDQLTTDTKTLRATFAPRDTSEGQEVELGVLNSLQVGAGDVHRHGRSVIMAGFSSGLQLVYKPRSLAVDCHFTDLVAWVNAKGQSPPLRAVRTITREDHGWAEFIAAEPCREPADVSRFYERFGAQLALLHVLEATDFHFENVIAAGEHPVLIDLEALFHPQPALPGRSNEAEWIGWSALHRSVLRAGVLPFRIEAGDKGSLDLSALGGGTGQRSPDRHLVLAAGGTDEMHFVRDYVQLPASQNRPTLGADTVDPSAYVDHILTGFAATYRLLMRHRDELLAANGPVLAFAGDTVRVVLRPTRQYALVLGESYHPDVLRDALERDRLIDRLWVAVPTRPEFARVIQWEHADLVDGDVPLFTSRPGSRDLVTAHGTCIEDFFPQSGLDAVIDKLAALSEDALSRECWVIQASLAGLTPGRHGSPDTLLAFADRAGRPPRTRQAPTSDECVEAAQIIARRLAALALRRGDQTSWLSLGLQRERDWAIQPIGVDLYGGILGIAFFLAHAAKLTGDDGAEQLARMLVSQATPRAQSALGSAAAGTVALPGSIGAFGVVGGTIYTFAHLATLWHDQTLADTASEIVTQAAAAIGHDQQLDLTSGTAGFVLACIALERVQPRSATQAAIQAGANYLLTIAERQPAGIAWRTTVEARQPLTGVSHGASGMALALVAAGALLGDRRMTESALDAFRYERSTLDHARANWPDYRILGDTPLAEPAPVMWSWCHGAPGVGLVRLTALEQIDDAEVLADLHLALGATADGPLGANDSLCHGDLGNLELLLRARERGHSGAWESALDTVSADVVGRARRGEWRCGVPAGVETPGLMIGLAGIGYGLLRLGHPRQVPSLLSLEPPISTFNHSVGQ